MSGEHSANFLSRVRDHYVDQFRAFVKRQLENCSQGAAEVKLELNADSEIFRRLYCVDFIRNDGASKIIELQPDRVLNFEPITGSVGDAILKIEHVRWDDVLVYHNAQTDFGDALSGWFDTWFDPEDRRYVQGAELGNVIHSLGVRPQLLSVDFGTAEPEAFWELIALLERTGASELRVSSSRAEAECAKPI
jgi:hypothetical protein